MMKQVRIFISVHLFLTFALLCGVYGQRIVTIQLEGTQYYVSKMNPYASELNYHLAYQYCRSIGLQLLSLETKEKADSITEYLKNAGYSQYDFWTSGNHLGSNMLLWMSTGLPFNATFNYLRKQDGEDVLIPNGPMPMSRRKRGGLQNTGCIALKSHTMDWDSEDCSKPKDFICEQTRCYFYNYGSIPVSSAQGTNNKNREYTSTVAHSSQTVPQYVTKSTSLLYPSTTSVYFETTTPESKVFETESVPTAYLEEQEEDEQQHEEVKSPEDNDIDLTQTTDPPTTEYKSEPSSITEVEIPYPTSNRIRSNKILNEENSPRNMPETHESLPWTWAKNILLEKPVLKKTSVLDN